MKRLTLSLICATIVCLAGCGQGTPQVQEEYVHCRSLAGDRTALKVFEWEFNAVSEAINSYCTPEKELTEKQIIAEVSKRLRPELRESLRDVETSIKVTLLELEVRGVYTTTTDEKDTQMFRRAT